MDFMTIGDKNFFYIIDFSAKQIKRFYHNSKLYIYDWGFTTGQVNKLLDNENTEIINWKDRLNFEIENEKFLNIARAHYQNKDWKYYVKRYILRHEDFVAAKEKRLEYKARTEYLFCQKPVCISDCANYVKNGIIYLDGDAFLVNKIDGL